MATRMNGLTRLSLSLTRNFRTHRLVNKPETSSGKLRPCRPLLQLVVVDLLGIHSISRSVEVRFRSKLSNHVILLIFYEFANSKEDISRWAVCLGRDPVEKISIGPKDKLIQVGNLE